MSKNMLSFVHKQEVAELLKDAILKENDGYHYQKGYDDVAVANLASKKLKRLVTPVNVKSLRVEIYGRLETLPMKKSTLERQLVNLQAKVDNLQSDFEALVKRLGE